MYVHGFHVHLCEGIDREKSLQGTLPYVSTAPPVAAHREGPPCSPPAGPCSQGLMEVVATQAALDVMLEGQDYAGALDLLATLRSLLQKQQLAGLQCLRHLPARLMDVSAAVDQALAGDFLAVAANGEVRRIAAQAAADAEAHPGGC